MELEFKLRQQNGDLQLEPMRGSKNGPEQTCRAAKWATDENNNTGLDNNNNNNNNSNSNHDDSICLVDDKTTSQTDGSEPAGDQWRSLSPNPIQCGRVSATSGSCAKPSKGGQSADGWRLAGAEAVISGAPAQDEAQLMSIDPTLCHLEASAGPTNLAQVTCNGASSTPCGAAEDVGEREEQSLVEEFSSSSSSFGPMSMVPGRAGSELGGVSEDEEHRSGQSGSVLTVIARGSAEPAELDSDIAAAGPQVDEEETGGASGDIGVAFESLHFDTEIKSSRQEKVDEELVGPSAPPVLRRSLTRINGSAVKSVCNFISAAILDADKQVQSLTGAQEGAKAARRDVSPARGANRLSRPVAGGRTDSETRLSRASFFVQQQHALKHFEPVSHSWGIQQPDVGIVCDGERPEEQSPSDGQVKAETFKADLSSIFEANVRREIERFETNSSSAKKLAGAKLATKSGLTEWRIAEEIRLFNERELELKRRFETSADHQRQQQQQQQQQQQRASSSERPNGQGDTCDSSDSRDRWNWPKGAAAATTAPTTGAAIRLSTCVTDKARNKMAVNTLQKFIASGGKRFVFSSSQSGQPARQVAPQLRSSSSPANRPARSVDYKAADSLACKERPNVKPGSARKVIESFSRLSSSEQLARGEQPSSACQPGTQVESQKQSNCCNGNNNWAPSAEWKIQEELREMRAREAELRSQQRSNQKLMRLQLAATGPACEQSPAPTADSQVSQVGQSGEPARQEEQVRALDRWQPDGGISFSSECLYPIKQTIDSFRKFSSQASGNNQVPSQHNSVNKMQKTLLSQRQQQQPQQQQQQQPLLLQQEQQTNRDNCLDASESGAQKQKANRLVKFAN